MNVWVVSIAESAANYQRVADLCGEVQGPGERTYCERRLTYTRYRPEFTRYIELDGRVVSAALLHHDRWLVDGAALDTGYLENILTHPDYRGHGLFTALLHDSLRFLRDEGFPLAALHGGVERYARFGYTPVRWHAEATLPTEAALGLPLAGSARPFSPDDLGAIATLYADTYSRIPTSPERSAADWQWLLPAMEDVAVVQDAAGTVVAYARIEQRLVRTKLRVVEAAAASGQAAISLLAALGTRAEREDLESIYLALPQDHPVARAAIAAGGTARLAGPVVRGSRWGHADQAQALDLRAALAALTPVLNRRLACSGYADWTGSIAVDVTRGTGEAAGQSAGLNIGAGAVHVASRDRIAEGALRLPAVELAPLLLGTYGARELASRPGVEAPSSLLGLLDVLFPPLWPTAENEDWWIEG